MHDREAPAAAGASPSSPAGTPGLGGASERRLMWTIPQIRCKCPDLITEGETNEEVSARPGGARRRRHSARRLGGRNHRQLTRTTSSTTTSACSSSTRRTHLPVRIRSATAAPGTLISPTVMVTAGHCTHGRRRAAASTSSSPWRRTTTRTPSAASAATRRPGIPYRGRRHLQASRQLRLPRRLPGDEGRWRRRARPGRHPRERVRHPAVSGRDRPLHRGGRGQEAGSLHGQRLRPAPTRIRGRSRSASG